MFSLIVTRPRALAEASRIRFKEKGCKVLVCPVLEPRPLPVVLPDPTKFQAVIATSQHVFLDAVIHTPFLRLPFYAVGDRTAECARSVGYSTLMSAKGNGRDLLRLLITNLRPEEGKLVYWCAPESKKDLPKGLERGGFHVESVLCYTSSRVETFPTVVAQRLQGKTVDGVCFYSARCAKLFLELAASAGVLGDLKNCTAFCLSPEIARTVAKSNHFATIRVADRPDETSLMEMIHE